MCSDGEYHIQPLLPGLDLLHYTSVSSPSHSLWLPRWRSIRSIGSRPRANTRFIQVMEPPLPFADQEFDCVYSTIVLQHIPFPHNLQYLSEFFRISCNLVLIDAPSQCTQRQVFGG